MKLSRIMLEGKEIIVDVVAAGSTLGTPDQLQRSTHFHSVVTITSRVEVASIETPALLEISQNHPSFLIKLLSHLAERTQRIQKILACMNLKVRQRLLTLIGVIFAIDDEASLTIPLSNVELAQLAQTTPETVSRIISQLEVEGHITRKFRGTFQMKTDILRQHVAELS